MSRKTLSLSAPSIRKKKHIMIAYIRRFLTSLREKLVVRLHSWQDHPAVCATKDLTWQMIKMRDWKRFSELFFFMLWISSARLPAHREHIRAQLPTKCLTTEHLWSSPLVPRSQSRSQSLASTARHCWQDLEDPWVVEELFCGYCLALWGLHRWVGAGL